MIDFVPYFCGSLWWSLWSLYTLAQMPIITQITTSAVRQLLLCSSVLYDTWLNFVMKSNLKNWLVSIVHHSLNCHKIFVYFWHHPSWVEEIKTNKQTKHWKQSENKLSERLNKLGIQFSLCKHKSRSHSKVKLYLHMFQGFR